MTAAKSAASVVVPASSRLASLAAEADTASALPVSLYVHVPFCLSKCAYCDFYSLPGAVPQHAPYVDAVLFEAGHWSHYDLLDDVPTLYLGGGTPTALGDESVRLLAGLRETARLRTSAEVTVETNPETTAAGLTARLIDAGANRFSLGVQSFDDEVLRTLGRCHDAAGAERAAAVLAASGASFSIDLICGVPGQTFASWDETLERAIATGARHVSVYPLSVEEGTPLARAIASGATPAPDPDRAADMMLAAEVALASAGIARYEVANYAQPGHESQHNTVYWTGGAYLGLGPGAASMLPFDVFRTVADSEGWALPEVADPARARFTRGTDLAAYVHRPLASPGPFEVLTAAEALREDVMLGLRLVRGVPADLVERAELTDTLEALEIRGLVRLHREKDRGHHWETTPQGWLLGNEVFREVWTAE